MLMSENKWNELIAGLPDPHLLQTYEWGQVKARYGWQPLYLVWMRSKQGLLVVEKLDQLAGLEPGARYQLRAWVKGKGVADTSGILGVCSDLWGNESSTYAGGGPADGLWHEITLSFTAPAGIYHVILRYATAMDRLAIDDLSVERLP